MKGEELEDLSLLKSLVYELTYKDDFSAKDLLYHEKSRLEEKVTPPESFERFIWRVKLREGVELYFLELGLEQEIVIDETVFQYPFCFHFNLSGSFLLGKKREESFSLTKDKVGFFDYPVRLLFQPKGKKLSSSVFINVNSDFLFEYLDKNIFSPEEYSLFSGFFPEKKSGLIHFSGSIKNFMREILMQLQTLPFAKKYRKMYLEMKIAELIWTTLREVFQVSDPKYYKVTFDKRDLMKIERSKEILLEDISAPPTLAELANLVRLNEFKLKIGFKKLFGMPPYTFVQEYRMEMARRLLEERTKSVTEVASEIGYKNFSKFSAAFRKKFGKNPSKMYD